MRHKLIFFGVGVILAVAAGLVSQLIPTINPELQRPAFLAEAPLAHAQGSGSSFLEEEAGIAAYVKIDRAIEIAKLRESFKVVEQLNDNYLTGQIAVPDLKENWHPRVFVSQDGWVVAYYPKAEPTSRMLARWIFDDTQSLSGSTLELAIREVLKNAGSGMLTQIQNINYYHFQHPKADRVMLIRENAGGNEDTLTLHIPEGLHVLDASWIGYDNKGCLNCTNTSGIHIDGESLVWNDDGHKHRNFGSLLEHLSTDQDHKIGTLRGKYGIIILYQAP